MTVIKKCPICNRVLEEVTDKDRFLIDRRCNKYGISWSIFDLKYTKKIRPFCLDKWIWLSG